MKWRQERRWHLKGVSEQTPFFQELMLHRRSVGANRANHHGLGGICDTNTVKAEADPKLVEVFVTFSELYGSAQKRFTDCSEVLEVDYTLSLCVLCIAM